MKQIFFDQKPTPTQATTCSLIIKLFNFQSNPFQLLTTYMHFDPLNTMLCLKFEIESKNIEKTTIVLKNQQNTVTRIQELSGFLTPTIPIDDKCSNR